MFSTPQGAHRLKPCANRLGENIRSMREHRDLSGVECAEKLGIAQSMLSGYERGTKRPSLVTLAKMSALFECEVEELLAGVGADELLAVTKDERRSGAKRRKRR